MNLFYNENQFENKKRIIQRIVEMNDINYIFILIPVKNSKLKKEWKELSYELGIDIIVLSFKQFVNICQENNLKKYNKYHFNEYFNIDFNNTLFIIDQFEYMSYPASKSGLFITKLIQTTKYNINFINHFDKGIVSHYLIDAFIIKNYYINLTDFCSEHYKYYSNIDSKTNIINFEMFKRNILVYNNDKFQINKDYESCLKNKHLLQQFLNIFMNN